MRSRLPQDSELEKFLKLIRSIKEPAVRRYFLRSFHCFRDGHLEASIVMAWAGIERYCHLVAHDIGIWYFEEHFKKKGWKVPERWEFNDYEKISQSTKVFIGLTSKVKQLRTQRHKVAHGTGEFFSKSSEVLDAILSVRPVITKGRDDEKFADPVEVAKFLKKMDMSSNRVSGCLRHFPDNTPWPIIFDEFIDEFLSEEEAKLDSIRRFLRNIYAARSNSSQLELWSAYIDKAMKFLSNPTYEFRSKQDICSLLAFPKNVEKVMLPVQLKLLCEYLIDWLEREVD
ncbi:MAG: hypothetical protein ONB42_20080 [candidate division KSB1 bacterium]|nr:hypothetical protein [candidate division KSB1 bacterium]